MKTHNLPALPYSFEALEPFITKETLDFHYNKHHKGYVEKLNRLLPGTPWENASLEEIIRGTFENERKIFNQAAQVWNHTFYWNSLAPVKDGGGKLGGELEKAIVRDFKSFEMFKETFNRAATGVFGSGWAWLICDETGLLKIETTANADNPLRKNQIPLLTCDVWEHAYYIDYRNERTKYLGQIGSIFNWRFAEENYSKRSEKAAA